MRSALLLGLCVVLFASVGSAQTISTSRISGVIQDPSGAAVAGAEVKLTQTDTGAVRTATSRTDGSYTLPDLTVGSYKLEVTKEGFSKYVQTGLVLQVGANPTIDVGLKVGAVTQEVTVQAESLMVETQSTGVGQVIAPQQVQDLPLNGRQLTDLLTLTGAVGQGRAFRASYPSSAVVSIAGGAQGSVAYWLDGGTHNDPLSNQNLPLPFPDTVEEFKVETSSLPAQYGTHPSGAVNVVTKSGGNSFHGDVFEYVRNFMFDSKNTAFAAATVINPNTGQTSAFRPPLKRNQFGGTIGGPVLKDKLFFFAGWQDTIQRSSNPAQTTLPTVAMLAGDFRPCLGAAPVLNGLYVNNQTNPANFSPIIRALENHLPVAPGAGPVGSPTACGSYNYQSPSNFDENQGLARIDYHASGKNTIFGRYFITNWQQPPAKAETLPSGKPDLLIGAIDGAFNRVQNLTLGDTYLFGSNTVNSIRVTGNRSRNLTLQNTTLDLAGLLTEAEALAVNPLLPSQIGSIYQQAPPKFPKFMPNFAVTAGFGGLFNSTPSLQPYDTLEFSDDLSLTRGAHQLSFGMDFINLRAFATNYLFNQGDYTFDGNRTHVGPPLPSAGLPDFMLGLTSATSGFAQDAPIPSIQHQNIFALYAQDAWKITRRVTVTAGLRWDPFFGHTDPKGHVVSISIPNIIADVHSQKYPSAPAGYLFQGDPGGPSSNKLSKNALDKWSPRLGVAWDPKGDGRMSIRAGFGIFYDFPNFSYDQFGFEEPWGGAATAPGGSCAATCISDPWGTTAEGSLANPFTFCPYPCTDVATQSVVGNPFGSGPGSANDFVGAGPTKSAYLTDALVFSYPQNVKPTYVMQYNLSVEKQLGTNWLISATYLGSQQRHLWGNNEANPGLQGPCTTNDGGLGPYPNGYPFPPGITCGAGGTTVAGPCPTTFFGQPLAPFVCNTFGPFFSLNNNRLFQNFGTKCSLTTSCYGETLVLEEQGTGNYNGLLLSVQHHFANHFTSTTNYTWSHCISDNYTTTLGFFLAAEAVPYDRKADRGNCPSADTHNIFNQSLVAETPKFSNHVTDMLVGHWRFSLSGIVQSGLDVSPILLVDYSGSGNGITQRPSLVPGVDPYCQPKGRTCWLNPAAFVPPAPYTFGNLKNNSLFGPGTIAFNTALERIFQIRESQQLMFRWEVFNLPNHANLYLPSTLGAGIGLPTFGQPTPASTAGLGALNQTINDPRVMQFALKYSF
ncbi:MAG TPA: TonB-dependent receptor [Candidatus Acidoferrales bacterium]|nr:TonB-dependent receptor [Candidatus Acidoferrales bacterium]